MRVNSLTQDINFVGADKVFHFLAYLGLTLLWQLHVAKDKFPNRFKPSIWICVLAILFGVLIEFLQGTFTSYRSFDDYDIVADVLGVVLAYGGLWLIFIVKNHQKPERNTQK